MQLQDDGGGGLGLGGGGGLGLGGGDELTGAAASAQVPQLEVLEATRVPVVVLNVPLSVPLMDTSEPVTAPLAVTWALQLLAARDPMASHEPAAPEAVLLYASVASGLPAPV